MGSWGPVRGGLGQNMCEREGGRACVRAEVLAGVCRGWGMCVRACVCTHMCPPNTNQKTHIRSHKACDCSDTGKKDCNDLMKSLLKSVMTGLMGNFRNSLKVHTSTSFITGGLEDNLLFKKLSSFQLIYHNFNKHNLYFT